MTDHEIYMQRCLQLAEKGQGYVAPNPLVGAVLVHGERVIGEGYHEEYGKAHAEVNCIASVANEDAHLIPESTLYVSLEPCSHFGKTPPCTDLIIEKKIQRVVIGITDPFEKVGGKGIKKLQQAGIEVITGICEADCRKINSRFFIFYTRHRPYIILKWAQTANQYVAHSDFKRCFISSDEINRIVHKWRSEEMSILVGTNTALFDNPQLTTRLWPGKNPVRLVLDMDLRLPYTLNLFDGLQRTIVFNKARTEMHHNLEYHRINREKSIVQQVVHAAYNERLQSIIVEGGSQLLQSFIDEGLWDEARVITNEVMNIPAGITAPVLKNHLLTSFETIDKQSIHRFINSSSRH